MQDSKSTFYTYGVQHLLVQAGPPPQQTTIAANRRSAVECVLRDGGLQGHAEPADHCAEDAPDAAQRLHVQTVVFLALLDGAREVILAALVGVDQGLVGLIDTWVTDKKEGEVTIRK